MNITFEHRLFDNRKRNASEFAEISKVLRQDIIKSLTLAGSGHSGGPLGISDIVAVLYFGGYMKYNSQDWQWAGRDRFLLSGGHMVPVQYSALARAGFFPVEELATLRKFGSRLQGHPGYVDRLPGIESSTGSLGQGISIAVGMAMSDLLVDKNQRKVYCVVGDGELEEGSCWEAFMAAAHHKLKNLCVIVDNNDCQIDGRVKNVMSVYPLKEKFSAFGFDVIEIDGNDYSQIINAFDKFQENQNNSINKPLAVIAKTIMGKCVSFMEDDYHWHGNPPKPEQAIKALEDLEKIC